MLLLLMLLLRQLSSVNDLLLLQFEAIEVSSYNIEDVYASDMYRVMKPLCSCERGRGTRLLAEGSLCVRVTGQGLQ